MKHVFVLAMDAFQRRELGTVRNAGHYRFYSVLDWETLVAAESIDFNQLLKRCRQSINQRKVPVDAIIAHWDFPTSVLAPILCKEYGLSSPSLEAVLKCEHKLWSRLEQAQAVPEVVPQFCSFDPFNPLALEQITLAFPFWIKPVKGFSSQLGFRINNTAAFQAALEQIREGIGRLGNAFNDALKHVPLPPYLQQADGNTCLAEEIITGVQIAPEGSVAGGKVRIHGIFDMNKDKNGTKLDRLQYPSQAPGWLKQTLTHVCERLLSHMGFNDGCFNVEFMWDEHTNRLRLIEVNPRISQSHSEMFIMVDGMSNHEVAIDVALGREPVLPSRKGPCKVAAKCIIFHDHDGVVTAVPSPRELGSLSARLPHTRVKLDVGPGDRLSEKVNQDAYHFVLGEVHIGANSAQELMARYRQCLADIPITILPVDTLAQVNGLQPQQPDEGDGSEDSRIIPLPGESDRESFHSDARRR